MNGQMARRIDDLSMLIVDSELVKFGVDVAQGLRGNMVALQQTNIKVGAAATVNNASGPEGGTYGGCGGYGYCSNDSNSTCKYDAVAQAQGNSAKAAIFGLKHIVLGLPEGPQCQEKSRR